jgi:hypothetical protein
MAPFGRFTSLGAQVQNMKKPETDDVAAAIEAVRTGSLAQLQARYERPLAIVGDITRALVTPAPGHRLFIADLSGIESRGLAWLCNETDKLEQWRAFDRTGDPTLEPYYRFGLEDLKLDAKLARRTGKTADLAFGYQGGLGAWRRLAPPDDTSSDQEIYNRRHAWIFRHPISQNSGRSQSGKRSMRSRIPASSSPSRASHSSTKTVFSSCSCRQDDASRIRLPGYTPMDTATASPSAMPAAGDGSGTTFSNARAPSAG